MWVVFQSNSLKLLHIHTMLCNYNCSHNKKKIHPFTESYLLLLKMVLEATELLVFLDFHTHLHARMQTQHLCSGHFSHSSLFPFWCLNSLMLQLQLALFISNYKVSVVLWRQH